MIDKRISVSFATGGVYGKNVDIEISRHGDRWTDGRVVHKYTVKPDSAHRLARVLNRFYLLGNYEMRTHLYFGDEGSVCPSIDIVRQF